MAEEEYFYTLSEFNTELPADSVEWCPAEPFRDILACGTYKLIENKENASAKSETYRAGRIYLLRVASGGKFEVLQQIDTSGVLDMKWMHIADTGNNRILLAVANSNGYLQIYQLRSEESKRELKLVAEEKVGDDNREVLALSLDWSTGGCVSWTSHMTLHIAVSDSQGRISHFTWREDSLIRNFTWRAHEFQAWIVAFDYCNDNIFYSGGDDSKFLVFDTRTKSTPVSHNREHTSGVTSIHSNITKSFTLATGSYDESLRLWDKRNFKRAISKTDLKGGIWRLKWDPFKRQYLFAACMYEDFKIVDCAYGESTSIVANYDKHCGLSYGCDWSYLRKEDVSCLKIPTGDTLVATCSYQDCALKLCAINFEGDGKKINKFNS